MRAPELGGYGCDAAWADDFHHALRVLLTGEREGWYEEFDALALMAKAFHRPHVHDGTYSEFRKRRFGAPADDVPVERFVVFSAEPRPGRQPRGRRPPAGGGASARCVLHAPVTLHAHALHGRGIRGACSLPVLHRPHRRLDRRRDPRRAPARVRRLRRVLRRGGPGPAGPGDLRAVEADPAGGAGGAARVARPAAAGPARMAASGRGRRHRLRRARRLAGRPPGRVHPAGQLLPRHRACAARAH